MTIHDNVHQTMCHGIHQKKNSYIFKPFQQIQIAQQENEYITELNRKTIKVQKLYETVKKIAFTLGSMTFLLKKNMKLKDILLKTAQGQTFFSPSNHYSGKELAKDLKALNEVKLDRVSSTLQHGTN